jgi:DUF4097 and DUF4098 domain-containing protein YvlB
MNRRIYILFSVVVLAAIAPATAFGKNVAAAERFVKEFPLDIGGEFWIDNPIGNIEIIGQDKPGCFVTSLKSSEAVDKEMLKVANDETQLKVGGDQKLRILQTVLPAVRNGWTSTVNYVIRVPRTVHVKVASSISERIRIVNIAGNVTVKNYNGEIQLENVTGAAVIESVNGNIIYNYTQRPMANAQLTTLNGFVMCVVPPDSNFEWAAEAIRGDFFTTMPVRGRVTGTDFHGTVNQPGGPTLSMSTIMGNVIVLRRGTATSEARSVRSQATGGDYVPVSGPTLIGPQTPRMQLGSIQGSWTYSEKVVDVDVAEVRGDARVNTGAGSVHLGSVLGTCTVSSLGGPIDLGDVFGQVSAHTEAGNILVHAAREGGLITTGGGMIRVIYAGGPLVLRSGGGDLVVRQAASSVEAETRSGDVNITVDPTAKSQKISAHTTRGNVILNLTPRFGADVDATVLTSDSEANSIQSDFNGLTVKRDRVNGKTRIHATGKINGGGEKVELYAEEGEIHLSVQSSNPMTISPGP